MAPDTEPPFDTRTPDVVRDATCLPEPDAPSLTMLPDAFTDVTLSQLVAVPVADVGAVDVHVAPLSKEKASDQPLGYVMSARPVSLTFVGSIVCVIVWLTVPALDTGIAAVRSSVDPGATDADDEVTVTADETADAIGPLTVTMTAAKMHAPDANAPRIARDSTLRCLREASDDGATDVLQG